MPGEIPAAIPIKRKPNCKPNMTSPYQITILKGLGGLIKKIAGRLTRTNRISQSSNGETSLKPNLRNIKFSPQIRETSKANKKVETGMVSSF